MVLKVTGFMPPAALKPEQILDLFAGMINVYAAAVAASSSDRLILDLVDDGEGRILQSGNHDRINIVH